MECRADAGVFLMTLFIQRAARRDTLALVKLDELLRVGSNARSQLAQLDEQKPEAINSTATRKCARRALEPMPAAED
jgi:low affinity Fe/Cu permease